jgi:hypothetical protein
LRLRLLDKFSLAYDLLFQRLPLRLDHFRRLKTQRQVVPAFPHQSVHFPGENRFAIFGETLQRSGNKFRFEGLTQPLKAALRGIREDLGRSGKVPGKLGSHILDHFSEFPIAQEVCLGEQYADLRCVLV